MKNNSMYGNVEGYFIYRHYENLYGFDQKK